MVQSVSKTLIIPISGYEPTINYTVNKLYSIQGVTTLVFQLSDVSVGSFGIRKTTCLNKRNEIIFASDIALNYISSLKNTTVEYKYTPYTNQDSLSVIVEYRNGSLFTTVIDMIVLYDNILDMDLTILNSQTLSDTSTVIPIINLESNSNVIYPVSYYNLTATEETEYVIYLKTNEETNTSLSATSFSALSTSNFLNTELGERLTAL